MCIVGHAPPHPLAALLFPVITGEPIDRDKRAELALTVMRQDRRIAELERATRHRTIAQGGSATGHQPPSV